VPRDGWNGYRTLKGIGTMLTTYTLAGDGTVEVDAPDDETRPTDINLSRAARRAGGGF
jgi:hypothetical protein